MATIETTANVGPDGVLRLEMPIGRAGQTVKVVLEVLPQLPAPIPPAQLTPVAEDDPWRDYRATPVEAEGIALPPPGRRKYRPVVPVDLPGPSASEILIRDRR